MQITGCDRSAVKVVASCEAGLIVDQEQRPGEGSRRHAAPLLRTSSAGIGTNPPRRHHSPRPQPPSRRPTRSDASITQRVTATVVQGACGGLPLGVVRQAVPGEWPWRPVGETAPVQVVSRRTAETQIRGLVTCMTWCSSGTGRCLGNERHLLAPGVRGEQVAHSAGQAPAPARQLAGDGDRDHAGFLLAGRHGLARRA